MVEDIDINQELVGAMLGRLGHTHVLATNGQEAIDAFAAAEAEAPFDLVLMDVHMPLVDGIQATRAIRARGGAGAATPIIALTASAFPDELGRCLAAGMNGHLLKPLTEDVLAAELARRLPPADPAPAAPPTEAAAAKAAPDLQAMYLARKAEALRRIAELWPSLEAGAAPSDVEAVRALAHGLSGVCGMFGESALGDLARAVEDVARDAPVDRALLLDRVSALEAALA